MATKVGTEIEQLESSDVPDKSSPSTSDVESGKKHERKCSSEDGIHYVDDDDGVEFALDAKHLNRVHEELEKLNIATDVINKLEFQLDESRYHFQQIHAKWLQRLEEMSKKYGTAIQKSRPYYEAMNEDRKIRAEAQEAAVRFERATSYLQVAKQQVKLTQDSLARQKVVEPDCLEVLNHHIQRVSEAEMERVLAEENHKLISQKMIASTNKIKQMEKENAKSIKKSCQYFDLRMEFRKIMDQQKALISKFEREVKQKKLDYTTSLRNLEQISDSIHEERSVSSFKRGNEGEASRIAKSSPSVPSNLNTLNISASCQSLDLTCKDKSKKSARPNLLAVQAEQKRLAKKVGSFSEGSDYKSGGDNRDSIISDFYCSSSFECGLNLEANVFGDEKDEALSITTDDESHTSSARNGEILPTSDQKGIKEWSRQNSLGGGVILLAQQLIRGNSSDQASSQQKTKGVTNGVEDKGKQKRKAESKKYLSFRIDETDVTYHTTPAGITPISTSIDSESFNGTEKSGAKLQMHRTQSDITTTERL